MLLLMLLVMLTVFGVVLLLTMVSMVMVFGVGCICVCVCVCSSLAARDANQPIAPLFVLNVYVDLVNTHTCGCCAFCVSKSSARRQESVQ